MSSSGRQLSIRSRPSPSFKSSSQGFRGGRAPRSNDVFIAVMGVTGSGKSSFISLFSDEPVKIGHGLNGCTSTVDVYACTISNDRTIYLIDTPGFDDTTRSDTNVLKEIAAWLADSYRSKILLHGIIYLHRITDTRMQGSARMNLLMFRQLCGQDILKNVVLVSTMWDKVSIDQGNKREKELIETPRFWGKLLESGSSFMRHDNTKASAQRIVNSLTKHAEPIATDLQRQLVDERRNLNDTSAGRELQGELLKEREKWAQERKEIERSMKEAIRQHDQDTAEAMREERDRYTKMIKEAENGTEELRANMESLIAERDKRVTRMEKKMEKMQSAHEKELRRFEEKQRQLEREKIELEKEKESERRRKRDKKREKEKERERQAEKLVQQQRQQQQIQTVTHNSNSIRSPYSLVLVGTRYYFLCPSRWMGNYEYPEYQCDAGTLRAASIGDVGYDGYATWIARYSKGSWKQSTNLEYQYPRLGAFIDSKGLNNIELCSLGLGNRFFVRWKDGGWTSQASSSANRSFTKYGSQAICTAFGYGDSYFLSYGTNLNTLCWIYNFEGYYSSLSQFLSENGTINVLAIALDHMSTTDWIIIYRLNSKFYIRWNGSGDFSHYIRNWWDMSSAPDITQRY